MKRLIVAVLTAFGVLVTVGAAPAMAADITVTTTVDVVDPTDGVISLREAFIIANSNETDDTIILDSGVEYTLDSCFVGELPHTQDEDLVIEGNGSSIFQTCFDRRVINNDNPAASLTINDLAMSGGFVPAAAIDGAGVKSRGPLTLDGVTIIVINAGSGGTIVDGGDAFSGDDVDVHIIDSFISSNTGTGLFVSGGPVTIENTEINNNTESGVQLIDGRPLIVTDSEFNDNGGRGLSTTGQGFALMSVTNTEITGNADTGLSCGNCSTLLIDGSTISNNGTDGTGLGGGINFITSYRDTAHVVTITDSTISGNIANREGGGLRVTGSADDTSVAQAVITIEDTTMDGNVTRGFFDIDGGAIYAATGDLTVRNSTLTDNEAGPLAGLTQNHGGAIFLKDEVGLDTHPVLEVLNSTLDGNQADYHGGAIYAVTDNAVNVVDSTITDNHALTFGGGGIYAAGADLAVLRSTIDGNTADIGGGIAMAEFSGFDEGSLWVTESTISNNESTWGLSGGGGVFINVGDDGVNAQFVNSTVSGNTSANQGGGIMAMQTSRVTLFYSTVVRNTGVNGANVFIAARDLDITASVVAEPTGSTNCDLGAATNSFGNSFADDTSCNLGGSDTEAAIDPELGPLAPNGGPTDTHMPATDGPLAGLVPAAACGPATDQRGVARPQGTDCEPGSVEIEEGMVNMIMGTPGNDILWGTPGPDHIMGLGGNDIIFGGGGEDVLDGGPGRDRLFGQQGGDTLIGRGGRDVLVGGGGPDVIHGGGSGDIIKGKGGPDVLNGNFGDDAIFGGPGNDRLRGGPGYDLLDGGPGSDSCSVGPGGGKAVRC